MGGNQNYLGCMWHPSLLLRMCFRLERLCAVTKLMPALVMGRVDNHGVLPVCHVHSHLVLIATY